MSIKSTLAAAAAGALLAIPVTAGAIGATDSPPVDTPCADADWMQEHWSDPAHWAQMESFMEEHWDDMASHMSSDDFDHGPGMMNGLGMHGYGARTYGPGQGDGS